MKIFPDMHRSHGVSDRRLGRRGQVAPLAPLLRRHCYLWFGYLTHHLQKFETICLP